MGKVGDDWPPGVLSYGQVEELCDSGCINLNGGKLSDDLDDKMEFSSFDLHLTDEGYQLTQGSVKPFGKEYLSTLLNEDLIEHVSSKDGIFSLKSEQTYLFKLRETLNKSTLSTFYGQATGKSSVGRVDVLARLIVEGMEYYESFDPKNFEKVNSKKINMYVEITPITFDVLVKVGTSLNQLRIFQGNPSESEISGKAAYRACLGPGGENSQGELSINLESTMVDEKDAVALKSKKNIDENPIALWKLDPKPDPSIFWEICPPGKNKDNFQIKAGSFYILRSKERIRMPKGVAIYAQPITEEIGEMRIHYAGFVHPCFGNRKNDEKGTPLIFEVRGHNVDVNLRDGEPMARLQFYRMSEDGPSCAPKKSGKDNYENQELKLSNFFAKWPNDK